MSQAQSAMPTPLPLPITSHHAVAPTMPSRSMQPALEVPVYASGPVPCRCGRYLSEDFDGRLFCRGCEGTDTSDITPRLPLCHRRP
jgi:hypothetical protein